MTKMLWDSCKDTHDILITFANTGCEDERTLEFIHECEVRFGWPVVWLEAVVNPQMGKGIRHKIVSFETASRNGEPFEAAIAKHGIFCRTHPQCTSRLKEEPMESHRKEVGFTRGKKLNYDTAIGIRYDEIDRMSSKAKERRFIYPLIKAKMTKRDVALEIATWGFDLQIPGDHYGNCVWCWKKSLRKHLTLAKEAPEVFDFPRRMEEKYGTVKAKDASGHNGRRWFFRGNRSVDDIIGLSKTTQFQPYKDDPWEHGQQAGNYEWDAEMDTGSACGEGCEIGHDHDD